MSDLLLDVRSVTKSFGGVKALQGVNMAVRRGSVHALIGENGAGKSTLMKVLSGAHVPDSGGVFFAGHAFAAPSPAEARRRGVAMIYQELALCPDLTVAENIMLGMETTCAGVLRTDSERCRKALASLGYHDLSLESRTGDLSPGVQQIVEIARALVQDAKLIIFDEPTR